MKQVILVTGASSGFGALTARELAKADHTVYASMRETTGRNAPQVAAVKQFGRENNADLRAVELDLASQDSVDAGIKQVLNENGRLDVIVHNAGHMVFGPTEAFTPEQLAHLYDVNTPFGKRPFRITVDPAQDGSEVVTTVLDRIRAEFLRRIGFADLLSVNTKLES